MLNQWFKFYGADYLGDPKMLALSASERSCWLTLLCYASMSHNNGVVQYLNEGQLMAQSGVSFDHEEWHHTKGVLEKLQNLGMIVQRAGEIEICHWKERQESFLTGAERQARFRAKQSGSNAGVTQSRHESNARKEEKRKEEKRDTLVGFDQFWKEYPKKAGKKAAQKAWSKVAPDEATVALILAAVASHRLSPQWTKDGGQYIPHAATWLNGERWNDELKGGKVRSSKYDDVSTTTVRN